MKRHKYLTVFLVLSGFLLIFGQLSYAAEGLYREGAQFLTDIGKTAYERGQLDEAAHEFSKALMVDPGNAEAKEYLQKIGISQGLYPGAKTTLKDVTDLSEGLQSGRIKPAQPSVLTAKKNNRICALEKKIADMEKKMECISMGPEQAAVVQSIRETLGEAQAAEYQSAGVPQAQVQAYEAVPEDNVSSRARELEIAMLEQKLNDLKSSAAQKDDQQKNDIEQLIAAYSQRAQKLRAQLKTQEKMFEEKIALLKKRNKAIQNLRAELEGEKKRAEKIADVKKAFVDRARRLKGELRQKDDQIQAKAEALRNKEEYLRALKAKADDAAEDAAGYEDQMSDLLAKYHQAQEDALEQERYNRRMLEVLESYLYVRRNENELLKDQNVYQEIEVSQAEHTLLDRLDELVSLHKDVDYYLARLEERDALLGEKNKDIRFLYNKVEHNRASFEKEEDVKFLWEKLEEAQKRLLEKREEIKALQGVSSK